MLQLTSYNCKTYFTHNQPLIRTVIYARDPIIRADVRLFVDHCHCRQAALLILYYMINYQLAWARRRARHNNNFIMCSFVGNYRSKQTSLDRVPKVATRSEDARAAQAFIPTAE